jgi:sugar phosphate isomerase/epimerase
MKIAVTATPAPPRNAPLLLYGDLARAFRIAAEAGCQGVEIHMRRAEDVDLALVKRLMREYGQGVPTLGTGMAAADGLSFAHPDAQVRAAAIERVRGHIEFAAEVGSAVTIGSLSGKLGVRQAAVECFAELCSIAAPLGVTILLEPLNRYECDYINRLSDVAGIAYSIGAPNLKVLADTFHMNIEEGDIPGSLKAAGALVGHVHLADTNREAPGHGHLDIAGVLGALDDIGYQGYLSFEVLPLPDAQRAIRDGIDAVHAALGAGVI